MAATPSPEQRPYGKNEFSRSVEQTEASTAQGRGKPEMTRRSDECMGQGKD